MQVVITMTVLRKFIFGVLLAGCVQTLVGQTLEYEDLGVNDSLYREDQFFLGFSYNLMLDVPEDISLAAFSGGLEFGFIRDMPLNERRNIAIGVGAGWAFDNFGNSLFIGEDELTGETLFRALDNRIDDYDKNRFSMQQVTLPLEFRWRTSTPTENSFWRVYLGFKVGYVYYYRSNFEQPGNIVRQTDIPELDRWRFGSTLSFGYSTFNFHIHYGLNPLFNSNAVLNGNLIDMNVLKFGLMFYLL